MAHGDTRREQRFAAAALAMQGLLARPNSDPSFVNAAIDAVRYADALLAQLDSTEANKDKTS